MAYQNTIDEVLAMFIDRTAAESTHSNRLVTRETESGNVALIAYGWLKIAEYNESRGVVTVFTGHGSLGSKTVNRYMDKVINKARDRGRDTVITGESPQVGKPNDTTHFIANYVSMDGKKSAVEKDAMKDVRESLSHIA